MSNSYSSKLSIRSWSEADRPREKLMDKGKQALSDAELIAILIGSGNSKESAVDLAKRILSDHGNSINELARLSLDQLLSYHGIGEAKAISILAALELGRRRKTEYMHERPIIKESNKAYEYIQRDLVDLPHEEFWIIMMNRQNKVLGKSLISKGGVAGTIVDLRLLLKPAIEKLASGIIICHNHPSGSLRPSEADIQLTKKVKEAAAIMDLKLLDHLIITDSSYFSFADEGIL